MADNSRSPFLKPLDVTSHPASPAEDAAGGCAAEGSTAEEPQPQGLKRKRQSTNQEIRSNTQSKSDVYSLRTPDSNSSSDPTAPIDISPLSPTTAILEQNPAFAGALPPELDARYRIDERAKEADGSGMIEDSAGQTRHAYEGRDRQNGRKVFIKHFAPGMNSQALKEIEMSSGVDFDCPSIMSQVLATSTVAGKPAAVSVKQCCPDGAEFNTSLGVRGNHNHLNTEPAVFHVSPFIRGGALMDEMMARATACGESLPLYREIEVHEVIRALADAIFTMHGKGVAHRDIKPQNVMSRINDITQQRETFLIDFGLMKKLDEFSFRGLFRGITNTGSQDWAPPEQTIKNTEYDPLKADVFSVGKVASVMLFGARALSSYPDGLDSDGLPRDWSTWCKSSKPSWLEAELSESLVAMLKGCLNPNQEARWSSTKLSSCAFLCKPAPAEANSVVLQRSGSSEKFQRRFSTANRVQLRLYEWHVLDLGGHEYPSTQKLFKSRYDVTRAQKPAGKQIPNAAFRGAIPRARKLGMHFYDAHDGDFIYIQVREEELAVLLETLPHGQVLKESGLLRVDSSGCLDSAPGEDFGIQFERTMTCARDSPSQTEVIDLVKQHALDPTSQLFRPYLHRKMGVYAKQVLEGTTDLNAQQAAQQVLAEAEAKANAAASALAAANQQEMARLTAEKQAADAEVARLAADGSSKYEIDSVGHPSHEAPKFVFQAPWPETCYVARGDYLALILKSTDERPAGEVYRLEKCAFIPDHNGMQRYHKICSTCRDDVGVCECEDGPHQYKA